MARLYHGSAGDYDRLLPSTATGNIQPSERSRGGFRDVIFFSSDFHQAREYAGPGGVVYECDVDDAVLYTAGKRPTSTIFVAPRCEIVARWYLAPRRRGEPQQYDRIAEVERRETCTA